MHAPGVGVNTKWGEPRYAPCEASRRGAESPDRFGTPGECRGTVGSAGIPANIARLPASNIPGFRPRKA